MDWWTNSGAWIFMFVIAFLVILKEWFKAQDIIDRLRAEHSKFAKEMRLKHWEIVTDLEWENQDLKEKLGR